MPRSDLILLDCDDVLLDFLPGFLGHARARGLDPDPAGPGQFNMAPWLGLSSADMIALIREFNEGEGTGFDTLDPIPGAVEGVRALRDAGYRLRVVSSFSDCPGAHSRRALNLERAFGSDAFEGLDAAPLGGSKAEILARHAPSPYVDDLLRNAHEAHEVGHSAILLRAHHNAPDFDATSPDCPIRRVADWDELLSALDVGPAAARVPVDNSLSDPACL